MEKTYSQAGQDLFANYICDYDNGYFLDIGCSDGVFFNNSKLLEDRGWNGLLIDLDKSGIDNCKKMRKSTSLQIDLMKKGIEDVLVENDTPEIIDYISFDVDSATEHTLTNFPFKKYRFKCMTFEHDSYRNGDKLKLLSQKILHENGYVIVCEDVCHGGNAFEDWWVDIKMVDKDISNLYCKNVKYEKIIEKL